MKTVFKYLILIFVISFLNYSECFSQNPNRLSLGFANRGLPITINDESNNQVSSDYGNKMYHKPTTYFNVDFSHNIFNNKIVINLSNYFTYTIFSRERFFPSSSNYFTTKRFKHDHLVDILFPLKSKNHRPQFIIGVGAGMMNFGTQFVYDKYGYDINGNRKIIEYDSKGNFKFFAARFITGIKAGHVSGFVIFNAVPDENKDPNATIWLEAKIMYSICIFKRNSR